MFDAAGWQVITVKFGRPWSRYSLAPVAMRCAAASLTCPTPSINGCCAATSIRFVCGCPGTVRTVRIAALIATLDDATLTAAIRNLGGHDLAALTEAYRQIDDTRPTVIIAYTIKGYGLPTEGHPQNHSALLSHDEYRSLAAQLGTRFGTAVAAFRRRHRSGTLCAGDSGRCLAPESVPAAEPPAIPTDFGRTPKATATTQAALGRVLLDLTREAPEAAKRVVTVSPDVSSTTNLGGWVNKVGVWSATETTGLVR